MFQALKNMGQNLLKDKKNPQQGLTRPFQKADQQ